VRFPVGQVRYMSSATSAAGRIIKEELASSMSVSSCISPGKTWTSAATGRNFRAGSRIGISVAWSVFLVAVLALIGEIRAQAPVAPAGRFVVVLDAAHGGDDTGAHLTSGQYEKSATLALSVRLRSLLGARGFQVVTTRESDQAIELNQRAEIANRANAQACLSLHVTESGSGVHLFTSSLAPASSIRFAAWKTAQSGWVTRSLALAGVINSALLQSGGGVTLGRTALPAIESMTCPAVAVEIAPERSSERKITAEPDDPDYETRIATALAAALLEWKTEGRQQ